MSHNLIISLIPFINWCHVWLDLIKFAFILRTEYIWLPNSQTKIFGISIKLGYCPINFQIECGGYATFLIVLLFRKITQPKSMIQQSRSLFPFNFDFFSIMPV
jgi:hypothetical protein